MILRKVACAKQSLWILALCCAVACPLLVGPVGVGPLQADDWNHWRGPEQNGISRELNLPDEWSLDPAKNLIWTSPIGGRATPIILNDRVYLNCRTDHDINDKDELIHAGEQVVCWDAKTGDVLWRDVFNVFQTDIPAPRVGWAAMCGDKETGNVYVHSVSGLFRCYNADGEVQWEHSLLEEYGKISGYGGRTQTPIIDENRVIVSFLAANWGETKGPAPKHYYYAFDKKTGELLWVSAPGGQPKDTNYSVPFIAVIDGQRLLIGGNSDGGIYAMQARTGKKVWGYRMSQRGLNTTAVTDGKHVFISHGEDNIDNTDFGSVRCIDATKTGDITDTGTVWRKDGIKAGYTAMIVKDGILYVTSDTGKLFAFDASNGEQLWEHALGTVGKGSPVWADGKIYVMEVNGNILTLKPSRDGCETINHVELEAKDDSGRDEIYASPAISNGRVVFVTRDRTICIGSADAEAKEDQKPQMPAEKPTSTDIATVLLTPYEVMLKAGEKVEYTLHAFDANGNFIKSMAPESIDVSDTLQDTTAAGNVLSAAEETTAPSAGTVTATVGDLSATSRVRVFNTSQSEWKWDFDGFEPMQVVPTWIRAFAKIKPEDVDGNTAIKFTGMGAARGRPSHMVWLGTPDMNNYTVQADVMLKEQRRRLASIGVTANRYNLIIKGNNSKLDIQSWAAHLRLGARKTFNAEPDVWYTMKIAVTVTGGEARILGKVWKRDEPEPAEWTIEAVDPRANENGSPGLYTYALADCYMDNIIVLQNK